MKTAFSLFQIFLLMCGVFGEDQEKTVSVMEGGSVTLNPDLTKIQGFIQILWKFGENVPDIARIDENQLISYKYGGIFKDRLQLNQTGFLTIKNMRTKHSGLYKAEIDGSKRLSEIKFLVTVYESPSVLDAGEAEMKSVSVKEGESVTLHTDVTELHGEELIVWRFGGEGKLIAKGDIQNKSSTLYITDERFRDRLQLNDQTGSLTINNMKNTDSGLYRVKISSSKQMINKRFIVTVSGLSPGAIAGIVVGVLLFIAAAVAGVIYLKFFAPKKKTVYVTEGESVTLETDIKIQRGDEIQWMFEDCVIAGIKGKHRETYRYDGPDERFKGRLELKEISGSLAIRNITTKHAGEYTLKMRSRWTPNKIFSVKISEMKAISAMEGRYVTLNTDTTIKKYVRMLWLFGDSLIAEIKRGTGEIIRYDDKRFRDRLKLDETTGDLTIKDIRAEHTGLYKLQIISDEGTKNKGFGVFVKERRIAVLEEGEYVFLKTHVEIQKDDQILWTFGVEKSLIAHIKEGIPPFIDERFRDRLELNEETGDLTITDITPEHTGLYEVLIVSSRRTLCRRFNVVVDEFMKVIERDPVTLKAGLTEIQKNSHIVWRFRDHDCPIAEIKGGAPTYHEGPDGRFRDRLKLDETTGDLTIRDTTDEHDGDYKLQIISDNQETSKIFHVKVRTRSMAGEDESVTVTVGDSVPLYTGLTEIQENSHIMWWFRDHDCPIAEIKGGAATYHEGPDGRFRDRLKLDKTTGDLTITDIIYEHDGDYNLQIISDEEETNNGLYVSVRTRFIPEMAREKKGKRENESATVEMKPLLNEVPDEVNEEGMSSL